MQFGNEYPTHIASSSRTKLSCLSFGNFFELYFLPDYKSGKFRNQEPTFTFRLLSIVVYRFVITAPICNWSAHNKHCFLQDFCLVYMERKIRSSWNLKASSERCFAEIGVRRKVVPHCHFFLKKICKWVQFYKICMSTVSNFTKNFLKIIRGDL